MTAEVEHRRFRTWEADTERSPSASWLIIFRYGLARLVRTWYLGFVLVATLILTVIFVGSALVKGSGGGFDGGDLWAIAATFLLPAAFVVFLVGCPIFSEDMRFNAHLFYFSKPLRVRDYLAGKAALLGGTMLMVWFLPVLLAVLLIPMGGFPEVPLQSRFSGEPTSELYRHDWRVHHVDSFVDWLYVLATLIPGTLVVLSFITSFSLMVSSLTRRAWHAAMGIVVPVGGLSLLGTMFEGTIRNAFWVVTGPIQWMYGVLFLPIELRFDEQANPFDGAVMETYKFGGAAVFMAYLLLLTATVVCTWVTYQHLRKREGML